MLRRAVRGAVALLGDAIEAVGSGEYREDLHARLRETAARAAELVLENASLRSQVDRLRFSGPTLWADETLALRSAIELFRGRFSHTPMDGKRPTQLANDGYTLQALQALLDRCNHMPLTRDELNEQCRDALESGKPLDAIWDPSDDEGQDVDAQWWPDPPPDACTCGPKAPGGVLCKSCQDHFRFGEG